VGGGGGGKKKIFGHRMWDWGGGGVKRKFFHNKIKTQIQKSS